MPPVTMKPDGIRTPQQNDVRNATATRKTGGFDQLLEGKRNNPTVAKKEFRVTNTGERVVNKGSRPRLAEIEQADKQKLAALLNGKASTSEIVATALQNHPLLANLPDLKKDLIASLTVNIDPLVSDMRSRKA